MDTVRKFVQLAVVLGVFLLSAVACNGQSPAADDDRVQALEPAVPEPDPSTLRIFEATMAFARQNALHERNVGRIMTSVGERFLEKPYEAGMLDVPDEEQLICRLDAFDCVTFVESTLAMARAIKAGETSYPSWANFVRDQRYRGGQLDGYCSRLHYFTEWIRDNEARGTVEDVTKRLGGIPLEKTLDFMTEHRDSYPRFAENDSVYRCIKDMEERLRGAELYYVPQDRIRDVYDQLRAGDILAFATKISGLDVTHTGLVYDNGDGTKGVLHASAGGGVKLSPDLQSYVQGVGSQIGIIVARPLEPRASSSKS